MSSFDKNRSASTDGKQITLNAPQESQIDRPADPSEEMSRRGDDDFYVAFIEPTQPLFDERTIDLAEPPPTADGQIPMNLDGVLIGYDPYNSGPLPKVPRPQRPNLGRLGKLLQPRVDAIKEVESKD